jgi:hypothetical protein
VGESLPFLMCAHCGDRIGVYEHAWLEHPDGSLQASSFLNIEEHLRRSSAKVRFFHLGCLAPDAPMSQGPDGAPSGPEVTEP